MNIRLKSAALAAALATATALTAGCQAIGGAEEPTITIDLQTERAIYRALATDDQLAKSQIFVSCTNGEVTLLGATEDARLKNRAEQLVKGINGVTVVHNNIIAG